MVAHLAGVIRQASPARLFIGSFECIKKGLQRGLGIDHNVLPARQLHYQIGPQTSALAEDGFLLSEIAIRQHACDLDNAPQLNFSPSTANVGGPQSTHQIASFGLQFLLSRDERLHLGL